MNMFSFSIPIDGRISRVEKYNKTLDQVVEVFDYREHENLVTDEGIAAINRDTGAFEVWDGINGGGLKNNNGEFRLAVGDGSTTPSTSDTKLNNFVAETVVSTRSNDGIVDDRTNDIYYGWFEEKFTFGTGNAAGNLTEFGLMTNGASHSTDPIATHGLFLDENGDPTTVTVQSDEELRLFYELRLYFDFQGNGDTSGTVTINGTNYNYTIGFGGWDDASIRGEYKSFSLSAPTVNNGLIEAVASNDLAFSETKFGSDLRGTNDEARTDGDGNPNYSNEEVNGLWYTTMTNVWGPDQANWTNGIRWAVFNGNLSLDSGGIGVMNMKIDPPLVKPDTDELTITYRARFDRK